MLTTEAAVPPLVPALGVGLALTALVYAERAPIGYAPEGPVTDAENTSSSMSPPTMSGRRRRPISPPIVLANEALAGP